jgi:hypothetical protein
MGSVSLKGTEGSEEVEEGRHGASSVGADRPFLRGELGVTLVAEDQLPEHVGPPDFRAAEV